METPPSPERPVPDPPPGPALPEAPAPPPGPQAPAYGGPVPPGGWEQPIAQQAPAWHGRQLASWGSRLAAYLVDGLILLVPVIGLTVIIVAVATGSGTAAWVTGIIGFLATWSWRFCTGRF